VPAFTVDWFVGSIVLPQQDFTIDDGGGFVAAALPAGSYYLRHTSSTRSLIAAFGVAVQAITGVPCSNSILRNRCVHLDLGNSVAVNWGAATALRDLLGFAGNLPSDIEHDATLVSPLLWSPGYPGTTKTIRGVDGYLVPHQVVSESDDGTQMFTYHFSEETHQDVEWSHIDPSRLRVATGTGGGTFYEFHRQVGMIGRRFLYHQDIVEDDSSTAQVTWTTQRGPYMLRREARSGDWYKRNVPNAEISSPLALPIKLVSEYA
jgi:hypothetical protein